MGGAGPSPPQSQALAAVVRSSRGALDGWKAACSGAAHVGQKAPTAKSWGFARSIRVAMWYTVQLMALLPWHPMKGIGMPLGLAHHSGAACCARGHEKRGNTQIVKGRKGYKVLWVRAATGTGHEPHAILVPISS